MKKAFCLLSAVVMLMGFTACDGNDTADISSVETSSIVYNSQVPELAVEGKIDGVNFAVGTDVDEVVNFYNGNGPSIDDHHGTINMSSNYDVSGSSSSEPETVSESENVFSDIDSSLPELDDEIVYDLTIRGLDTGDRIIKMYSYDTRYFYYNASPESGIAYIAYFADNFGYMIGHTTYDDIKTTVEADPLEDRVAEEDEMFFMVQPLIGTKMLSYQYGDYVLNFFFDENDKLFSTTIFDYHVWTE